MKKIVILVASLAAAALFLTSCGSSQECPAYGQAIVAADANTGVA